MLATLLVFIAVESRLAPLPYGTFDRRWTVFALELLGMCLILLSLGVGAAELFIPGDETNMVSVVVIAVGFASGLVLSFFSIRRIVYARILKALDDPR